MRKMTVSGVAGSRGRITLVALLTAAGFFALVTLAPAGECATPPKGVRGFIYDSVYNPVEGANVTITMKDLVGDPVQTYYCDATESDGYYTVSFAMDEWEEDYTVYVTAKWNTYENTNWTVMDDRSDQFVNVTLPTVIPEFSDIVGSPVTVLVLVTVVFFFVMRRNRR